MRISGVTINDKKRMEIALTDVFGIGRSRAKMILDQCKIDHGKKTKELNSEEEGKIRKAVEALKIEGNLKREISGNIKRLKEIKSYKGARHSKNLPVKGQRTKANSRTVRGNVRKTMGSGKRKVEKK
jgi:small subunit ribosomal protein S13